MNKQRLEAFSDGVFAIAITLLILTIKVPDVSPDALGAALVQQLPQVATYVLSFFVVALYWLAHHRMSHVVKQVDGTFVWLNMLWLLFVSVLPFPAALLARYPLQVIPICVYGFDLILVNITGLFITVYLKHHPVLTTAPIQMDGLRAVVPAYIWTNGLYLVAIALGWVVPWASYLIFAGVLVAVAVRYSKILYPFTKAPTHG